MAIPIRLDLISAWRGSYAIIPYTLMPSLVGSMYKCIDRAWWMLHTSTRFRLPKKYGGGMCGAGRAVKCVYDSISIIITTHTHTHTRLVYPSLWWKKRIIWFWLHQPPKRFQMKCWVGKPQNISDHNSRCLKRSTPFTISRSIVVSSFKEINGHQNVWALCMIKPLVLSFCH